MNDILELFYYLFSFWIFVFSTKFRNEWIRKFKGESVIEKGFDLLEAFISITIGLIIPIVIAVLLYKNVSFHAEVDSCLDSGGSYNYQECSCDYKNSHDADEKHQCK